MRFRSPYPQLKAGTARPQGAPLGATVDASAGFILSVNDVPETREVFGRFRVEPVSTRYTIAGGLWAEAKEIIATGPAVD
jgi:hypothetical protein